MIERRTSKNGFKKWLKIWKHLQNRLEMVIMKESLLIAEMTGGLNPRDLLLHSRKQVL
jgi:hypothetical protein